MYYQPTVQIGLLTLTGFHRIFIAKTIKEEIGKLKKLRQWFSNIKIRKIIRLPGSIIARMLGIRCPNCGANTMSELLWSCTHCGYPSPSTLECPNCGLHMAHLDNGLCPKCGVAVVALQSPPPIDESLPEIETVPDTVSVDSPSVEEIKVIEPRVAIIVSTPTLVPEIMPNTASTASPTPESVIQDKPSETLNIPLVIELPPPQTKEIPLVGEDFSVSVEQLADIFKIDIAKADAIYKEKVLRVKGTIETVVLGDTENHYIILSGYLPSLEQKVLCIFDKKYEPIMTRLIPGQRITVVGKYNGYDTYIRLMDSLPVA